MKKVFRVIVGIIYILLFLGCCVTSIKPGAAIFYSKVPLEIAATGDEGIYEARFSASGWFYNLDLVLIRETTLLLTQVQSDELNPANTGEYSVELADSDEVVLRIVPAEDGDTDATFQALIRAKFITSSWLKIITFVLAIGLVLFFSSILLVQERRRAFFRRPLELSPFHFRDWWLSKKRILDFSLISSSLSVLVYVLLEWIFFVSKSSFMDILSFWDKISVLIITGFALMALPVILSVIILVLDLIFSWIHSSYEDFVFHLPSAFGLTCLALILIDNFTYTVFQFGIVKTTLPVRLAYAIAFLAGFILLAQGRSNAYRKKQARQSKVSVEGIIVAAVILIGVITLGFDYQPAQVSDFGEVTLDGVSTPNIIFISDDGLNTTNMSVYGYKRETTPFLEELAETSLVMLNNFTNANTSTGSDTALLTGKLPFETGVLYPPNALTGQDMYEHLPGLLRQNGYRTISLGVPHFVDVNVINFQNAFDEVNAESNQASVLLETASSVGYSNAVHFFTMIAERIVERLGHIFLVEDMDDPYAVVMGLVYLDDQKIMNELKSELLATSQSDQPLFAHVHLVTTHGPTFESKVVEFSTGQTQDQEWMTDFYDDAILAYDQSLREFVGFLDKNGLLDNTILVIYSDHASQWKATEKIPLIIHFPQDQFAGTISESTQNLDVAATVLDYMGIKQPDWMGGDSLLGDLSETRLVFSAEIKSGFVDEGKIDNNIVEPPFYQFGKLNVIQCQMLYQIDLQKLSLTTIEVENYVNPCSENVLASKAEIWSAAGQMLIDFGFHLPDE